MTTENTDAAARILTKAIRKLTAQLAEADETIRRDRNERMEQEWALESVRTKLGGPARSVFSYFVKQPQDAAQAETAEELAEKRMAELADERKTTAELRPLAASQANDLVLTRDRIVELETRIADALAALPSSPSDEVDFGRIAEARRILTGADR